ncbi:MAG: peptidoglycan editing factor PgeF [Rhodothermales bacterium]|nr:peptidoglycan editing factor PgeF [Rhodothermales bacterium]
MIDKVEGVQYRRPAVFDGLAVTAGFSTRHGGVSGGRFRSLNLGLSTGDDDETVRSNRAKLFESAGLDPLKVAIAGQVHGSKVRIVDAPGLYPGIDALVTQSPGLVLAITAADCAVVLLADVDAGIVAAAHAGWRGTVGAIVPETVRQMRRAGAALHGLRAYISPCISLERFEVGEEVADEFANEFVVRHEEWPRPHVNLRSAIAAQLASEGVSPDRIEISTECTYDHADYYSYRADAGDTGRMMGFIAFDSDAGTGSAD